jgi:hypothetical protein
MKTNNFKLVNYFDALINNLDFAIETAINDNQLDKVIVASLNKQRDTLLAEIDHAQAYNLRALADLDIKPYEQLSDADLFQKFCFFIKLPKKQKIKTPQPKLDTNKELEKYEMKKLIEQEIGLVLIITDKFLTSGQIRRFQFLFNSFYEMSKEEEEDEDLKFDSKLFFEDHKSNVI